MSEWEPDKFEAELHRLSPARAPEKLMTRLRAARPAVPASAKTPAPVLRSRAALPVWQLALRWLAPALAVLVITAVLLRPGTFIPEAQASGGFSASGVKVDHELVSSFDAVAEVPGSGPVRFHVRKWNDQTVWTDKKHGTVIQQTTPRVEVIPVRFETY